MSSSGLIFAVIVGAWAAYLVPMWLRRQDELNEARPTERFSTALRLLTRRRGAAGADEGDAAASPYDDPANQPEARGTLAPDVPPDVPPEVPADPDEPEVPVVSADLRAYAEPVTTVRPAASGGDGPGSGAGRRPSQQRSSARARVLARRRRTTMVLFVAFTVGGVVALTSGPGLLWLPAVPALLLLAYVIRVSRAERRRHAVALDRRRAEDAARRLRQQRTEASAAARPTPPRRPQPERPARAVVEQTDHAEWVDQERTARGGAAAADEPDTWDPAPVPLPTYVNAPVAPRTTRRLDLDAPDTWSAARSTAAGAPLDVPKPTTRDTPATGTSSDAAAGGDSPRRTPLFDQYADDELRRRRAAGE